MRTFAELCHEPPPRSLWRERLQRRAGGLSVDDYLLDEANLRGFRGAYRVDTQRRSADAALSLEEVVVGLLSPHSPADARIFKLVLRILQSGALDPRRLWLVARRERADRPLYWLLQRVPLEERDESVRAISARMPTPPRGYRGMDYRYDPQRLVRRPARKEDLWRTKQRES
jgi:hypothetical protein